MTTTIQRPSLRDLLNQIGTGQMQSRARDAGISLSQLLERESPTEGEDRVYSLDAFSRVMGEAGITTISDHEMGYMADPLEVFEKSAESRALFQEWVRRQWVRAMGHSARSQVSGGMGGGGFNGPIPGVGPRTPVEYLSTEFLINTIQRPYEDDTTLREMQIEPAIPLSEVLARTITIQGEDYRSIQLVEPTAEQTRLVRVAEAAELPRVKITSSARTNRLHKFGRAIEASYELLRRQRIDMIAVHIRRIGVRAQLDQLAAAIDVAVNGDGSTNSSAEVFDLTDLDAAATPPNITPKALMAFRMKWHNPYAATTFFAREAEALSLLMLTMPNNYTPFGQAANVGFQFTPINSNLQSGIRLGITDDVPAAHILGFDSRFAVERVLEAGSVINESERWITRQVEILTMSENETYGVFDVSAAKMLNLGA